MNKLKDNIGKTVTVESSNSLFSGTSVLVSFTGKLSQDTNNAYFIEVFVSGKECSAIIFQENDVIFVNDELFRLKVYGSR